MTISEEQIESLNKDVERYEQKARQRAWLSTIVPLLFGMLLLGYTIWQIQISAQKLADVQVQLNKTSQELSTTVALLDDTKKELDQANINLSDAQNELAAASRELEETKKKLEETNEELKDTEGELEETTQELKNANLFVAGSYRIDIFDIKESSLFLFPAQEEVLFDILDMQRRDVGWNLNGFSESEGFNSPNFTLYILQKYGLISNNYAPGSKPWNILTPINSPSIGDIVYYEGGYTMFYFELDGQGFVIGMTPLGILSQKTDFAPILGYLDVPYP